VFQPGTMMSAGLVLPRPLFSGLRGARACQGLAELCRPAFPRREGVPSSLERIRVLPDTSRVWQGLAGSSRVAGV